MNFSEWVNEFQYLVSADQILGGSDLRQIVQITLQYNFRIDFFHQKTNN